MLSCIYASSKFYDLSVMRICTLKINGKIDRVNV